MQRVTAWARLGDGEAAVFVAVVPELVVLSVARPVHRPAEKSTPATGRGAERGAFFSDRRMRKGKAHGEVQKFFRRGLRIVRMLARQAQPPGFSAHFCHSR